MYRRKKTSKTNFQESGRQFIIPHLLKEHRKYICIQQETDEEDEEKTNETDNHENQEEKNEHESMYQDIQEIKNVPICDKTTTNKDNKRKTSTDEADDDDIKGRQEGNNTQHT